MANRRKQAEAPAPEAEHDWNTPEGENSAHDNEHDPDDVEDQDEGEGGDAPDDDAEADFAAMSNVDHDAEDGGPVEVFRQDAHDGGTEGLALGTALTPRQRAGLDPVDPATHVAQAQDRANLANAQTGHEAANVLDPISGTPSPGVTETVRHSAPGALGRSDMSGREPVPDPLRGLGGQASDVMGKLRKASRDAHARGRSGGGSAWVSLRDLGVHKAVLDGLVEAGHIHQETRPGGQFSPETGTVYRIADHEAAA